MAYTIDRFPSADSPRLGAMTLHPVAESVPRARRWFRKFIAPYNPACSIDDCVLMISELVTNAILYGRADETWTVRVAWYRVETSLRIEVHNPGFPASVRMRQPEASDAHGRGLLEYVDEGQQRLSVSSSNSWASSVPEVSLSFSNTA
ncbi:ATP-binding protein, partial [Streptomyces europaeiscabiei]|uniref:ATP-binding protein n=1 Tax=Streptomyces europaeiscabiei TaxID=146819 RepID=UPI00299FB5F3